MNLHRIQGFSDKQKNARMISSIFWKIIRGILLVGLCFIIVIPLVRKLITALMPEQDLFIPSIYWIPSKITFENFKIAFQLMNYGKYAINSALLTLLVSVLQLISSVLVGYGFARFEFKGKKIWFALVIFTLVVPPSTLYIPTYLNFRYFNPFSLFSTNGVNLLNSIWPFILTSITATGYRNGLFIYIMLQSFKNVPKDLEEAAYLDGASPFMAFARVMVPTVKPALVVIFVFSVVWQWNDLYFTKLYMSESQLLPFTFTSLVENLAFYKIQVNAELGIVGRYITPEYTSQIMNTAMILFIGPLLIFYIVLQKFFTGSIARTGIVG